MHTKNIYNFAEGFAEGSSEMTFTLGGKGANLARMCNLGLPVPPGFTISCTVCSLYTKNNFNIPSEIEAKIIESVKKLESINCKKFGSKEIPLLVSVRSGSRFSMPGMLDTVLNIGLNDKIVEANKSRFILDTYRRLLQMYGNVVLKVEAYHFEEYISEYKSDRDISSDSDLKSDHLFDIIKRFKEIIKEKSGKSFPQDVYQQLFSAISAVFESWGNDRAKTYRSLNNIPEDIGTAVNVQSMVFGNFNDNSASGVLFTRNPSNGQKKLFGEFISNAQGEDVVSGVRTPESIENMQKKLPDAYKKLCNIAELLEKECRDMQDIEFTVEDKKLYVLQTRSGKRSASAAVKIAVDMQKEGRITKEDAIARIKPESLEDLLHSKICNNDECEIIAKGLPASPGAASGRVVFSTEEAIARSKREEKIILVKSETSPEDIAGMNSAVAIVTTRGGMTSHAAVVTRGMGKACICALSDSTIDHINQELLIGNKIKIKKDDQVTVDGTTGSLILGKVETKEFNFSAEFKTLMQWVEDFCKIGVRANAENTEDIEIARKFNTGGIGLCRTEHMFFSGERINIVRDMIMADAKQDRDAALFKLLPIQKADFEAIFKAIGKKPTTIRLLDPPLHEFLPLDEGSFKSFKSHSGLSDSFIKRRIKYLKEENPMLGHRGCRLGISHPEIYKMQIEAILSAAKSVGYQRPEIMIPFVLNEKELLIIKKIAEEVAKKYEIKYLLGSMIELPSAALLADKIAKHCDFLSFGTNDLTQTTLGISRDDCSKFLNIYKEQKILEKDPFTSVLKESVGVLIETAIKKARSKNPNIKIGVCGEHGADPDSVKFFVDCGVNYVSCSPYRIPVAKFAIAQSFIKNS